MDYILIALTAFLILISMIRAYAATRTALHPLMLLGPIMLYPYVYQPAMLLKNDLLEGFSFYGSRLTMVLALNLLGVGLFCLGCLFGLSRFRQQRQHAALRPGLSPEVRKRAYSLAWFFGLIALGTWAFMFYQAGGLAGAYGKPYGGVGSQYGYLATAPILWIPAFMFLALARQGQGLRWHDWVFGLVLLMPEAMYGFLGARRGPVFRVILTVVLSWLLASGRKVSMSKLGITLAVAAFMVLFVTAYRAQLYVGSDFDFSAGPLVGALTQRGAGGGGAFVYSTGLVLTADQHDWHYWGKRYLAILFVRPIPKQFWPTKYEDVGVEALIGDTAQIGLPPHEWIDAVGWVPPPGSAPGFVADLFFEFSWGGLIGCYLYGLFFAFVWKKAMLKHGVWTLLYIPAMALCIYVPLQALSEFFHRFIYVSVPTILAWQLLIAPRTVPWQGFARTPVWRKLGRPLGPTRR